MTVASVPGPWWPPALSPSPSCLTPHSSAVLREGPTQQRHGAIGRSSKEGGVTEVELPENPSRPSLQCEAGPASLGLVPEIRLCLCRILPQDCVCRGPRALWNRPDSQSLKLVTFLAHILKVFLEHIQFQFQLQAPLILRGRSGPSVNSGGGGHLKPPGVEAGVGRRPGICS